MNKPIAKSGKFGRPRAPAQDAMQMDIFDQLATSDDDWVVRGNTIGVKCWSDPHHFEVVIAEIKWRSGEQEVE